MSNILNISNLYSKKLTTYGSKPSISLEFFPPKTKTGLDNLIKRIERLTIAVQPIFITITYSQLNNKKTLDLLEMIIKNNNDVFKNVNICCHLTCTNSSYQVINETLDKCLELGIKNILALRGDSVENDTNNNTDFRYAVDLVRYIKKRHGDDFCIGVAAYPEGHYNNEYNANTNSYISSQSFREDLVYLKEKLQAGASFIITQLFYNVDKFLQFYNEYKSIIPDYKKYLMIPGIMPINNFMIFNRATKLAHVDIPKHIIDRFPIDIRNDDDQVRNIGVNIMVEIIERIYEKTNHEVNVFHFYTLNLEKSIAQIISKSTLLSQILEDSDSDESDSSYEDAVYSTDDEVDEGEETSSKTLNSNIKTSDINNSTSKPLHTSEDIKLALRKDSDMEEDEDIIFDSDSDEQLDEPVDIKTFKELSIDPNSDKEIAPSSEHYSTKVQQYNKKLTNPPKRKRTRSSQSSFTSGLLSSLDKNLKRKPIKQHKKLFREISKGTNPQLGKTILWDEFTNGRFGDSRSPAFGEMDGYGPTLKVASHKAIEYWGNPSNIMHLIEVFEQYLLNSIPVLPWCDLVGITPETGLIQEQLLELINDKQMLTTSSQPSCNGISSDDKIFGWGPSNGKVYQKAFVEFFISKEKWKILRERLDKNEKFGYYCGNTRHFETSFKNNKDSGSSCVVTWGVFPNSEVQQTTILEEESFKAWVEEAFQLWKEWAKIFPKNSNSQNFINQCYDNLLLVEVVYHDYSDFDGLWNFLLEDDGNEVDMN
ncbi:hypothetical protein ACO0R3_003000 [Hanseniaspora guilliermondii]